MPEIALLSYSGAQQAAMLGLHDLFTLASGISRKRSGPELTLSMNTPPAQTPDIAILPPNMSGARGDADEALLDWLRAAHGQGAVLASVCAGAFWLGHAGLLDGRPATTHWMLEDEFCAAFPKAQLYPERLLIDDHDIVTAGGLMAWVDLGLFFVERLLGPDIVTQTARHMLVDPRGREQRNWRSFRPRLSHGDDRILPLQHAIESAPAADHSVVALAARARLSPRSLHRRFRAATGLTPNAYVQALRIEKARGLFERSRDSVATIARAVGYEDTPAFTRLFRSSTGLTPSEYRARFSVSSPPATAERLDRARVSR
ncbi:helix-turn-helix domain-containing protein [Rhodobacteraceae bacterium D3-12]|nr:helix-turn-helix domain-containing protein [Rhodobacteraceae bacterium D3-12]